MGGEKYLPCFNADGFVGSPPRGRGKAVKFRCTCGLQRITPAWAGKSKLALCTPSCPTDHPRAGREKNKELEGVWLPMGSPPRRRGKERSTALVGTPTRITPALAGKSYVFGPFRPGSWDHPRVGGEKQIGGDNGLDKQGSPPRGRGKVDSLSRQLTGSGITPAWAGKSWPLRDIHNLVWDHPRVGGEKFVRYGYKFPVGGSPPRGRGKVPETYRYVAGYGITPAWAGKSHLGVFCREPHRDHPRVGGEKRDTESREDSILGSPPRGRGKVKTCTACKETFRITPAWAGKSGLSLQSTLLSGDHPRVGGEKKLIRKTLLTMLGSPPRGRGKGLCGPLENCAVGITPAWAGKRSLLTTPGRFPWDHPRVGGEKSHAPPAWETNMGSPPRGRGKVMGTVVIGRVEGITPAWAGKSEVGWTTSDNG